VLDIQDLDKVKTIDGNLKFTLKPHHKILERQLLESYNNKTPIVLINKIDLNPNL